MFSLGWVILLTCSLWPRNLVLIIEQRTVLLSQTPEPALEFARDIEEQNPDPTLGRREGGSGHQRKPDRDRPEIATPFLCGAAAAVALIPERATH